jgi:capsular exopolysaccharide synthesis family protein
MTTLPQTTNVRLPRPASGGIQIAQAGGGGLALGGGGAGTGQGSNEIWRVIRAHIWMILLVTLVIAPAAGYGVNTLLARKYPRYTAAGYIQVQPQMTASTAVKGPEMADPSQVALEIRTQAQALRTDELFSKMLQRSEAAPTDDGVDRVRDTQWFRQFNGDLSKARADFEENLAVTPLQDTKLVKIEFTYAVPRDCKTIVYDLVSTYLEQQYSNQMSSLGERSKVLKSLKDKANSRLQALAVEKQAAQVRLNTDGSGMGRIGAKEIELSKLVGDQITEQGKAAKAIAEYQGIKSMIEQGQDPAGVDMMMQRNAPSLMNDEYAVGEFEIQVEKARKQYGEDNPKYKMAADELEMRRAKYKAKSEAARANARIMLLESAKSEAESAQATVDAMNKRVETLKGELADLNTAMLELLTKQEEEKGLREQVKLVQEQIDNVAAIMSSPASNRVSWMTQPETPRNRSFPKLPVTMALAIALGLAMSMGVAFLREAMDQSIRSPRDIAKIGQINLLGLIPDESDDPQSAGARLPVVIFDAPHSAMAESFRHVRTKLQHTASLDTTRSIMVTSPSPGDGKTVIACNIAAGLALNGRRILLVDANFRRPEVHKVFGLPNEQGFSDVLNAVVSFDEVVRETQVPNLSVMSAGPKPMNPTELFESQLLIDFIERALEEFDHVVFDTGPIMVVAEAQAMAPRVDGVVSVVRAKTNNRGLLQRMRDELRRTKAEHLGTVLNAVRAQGGGYYGANIKTYYRYANSGQ